MCTLPRVYLAGIPVRDDLILELARLDDDDALADRLEGCYRRKVKVLGLDIPERETIIQALEVRWGPPVAYRRPDQCSVSVSTPCGGT